jgi:hypothetical protein
MSRVNPSDLDSITITLSNDDYESNDSYMWSGSDTITLSDTVSGGSNTVIGGISVPWTTTTGISDTFTLGSSWNQPDSGKLKLEGENADIEINGKSLVDMLRNIEQRLNILKPNDELESEWSELKALGDQYRALEKHIQEKQATWDRLKAVPPPEIN